ncbi:MAG: hypothetical protein L6R37_008438 [Teloschistes peruensis]|nr:MAG: hypothetical protein L6R37_008438 [Teloschistes peruensis]
MKSTISFLTLLVSGVASSELLSCFSGHGQQAILNDKYPVKGTKSITLCDHPDKYSLKIHEATFDVKTFGYAYFVTFDAKLNFTEEVTNATLNQTLTLGSQPLTN